MPVLRLSPLGGGGGGIFGGVGAYGGGRFMFMLRKHA